MVRAFAEFAHFVWVGAGGNVYETVIARLVPAQAGKRSDAAISVIQPSVGVRDRRASLAMTDREDAVRGERCDSHECPPHH